MRILSFSPPVDENGRLLPAGRGLGAVKKAFANVVKNPLILGVLAGIPFALLRIKLPAMLDSALSSVGGTATPIALLVVGASFFRSEALTRWKTAAAASLVKLILLPAIFLPLAAALGFRNSEMIAVLIMTGAPTTVYCFIMAKNMRADSVLTSNTVLLSTILSAVSITFWLYLMRMLQWI